MEKMVEIEVEPVRGGETETLEALAAGARRALAKLLQFRGVGWEDAMDYAVTAVQAADHWGRGRAKVGKVEVRGG